MAEFQNENFTAEEYAMIAKIGVEIVREHHRISNDLLTETNSMSRFF